MRTCQKDRKASFKGIPLAISKTNLSIKINNYSNRLQQINKRGGKRKERVLIYGRCQLINVEVMTELEDNHFATPNDSNLFRIISWTLNPTIYKYIGKQGIYSLKVSPHRVLMNYKGIKANFTKRNLTDINLTKESNVINNRTN